MDGWDSLDWLDIVDDVDVVDNVDIVDKVTIILNYNPSWYLLEYQARYGWMEEPGLSGYSG